MSAITRATAKWKIGDWCYYEHELHQVMAVDAQGRVDELSNGHIRGGGLDNRAWMVPVTLENKVISETVEAAKDEVHRASERLNLNWPDLAYKFRCLWIEFVDAVEDGEKEAWRPVEAFKQKLLDAIRKQKDVEVDGVPLFRRW